MNLKIYQIDAFTSRVFGGNPAAVIPLEEWLQDEVMQSVALENNLSETVFYKKESDGFRIRYFTPAAEVDLCGHATLATSWAMYNVFGYSKDEIKFYANKDVLTAKKNSEGLIEMQFPLFPLLKRDDEKDILEKLNMEGNELYYSERDLMLVLDSEADVKKYQPDHFLISQLPLDGLLITAPGEDCDFVSRCFFPKLGILEDPVTGSAHCLLAAYWAKKIKKKKMTAKQISQRGGDLLCEVQDEKLILSGDGRLYMDGRIHIESLV